MSTHPDLADERDFLLHARRCLADMRERTVTALDAADAATEVDAEIARAHLAYRLRSLDPSAPNLAFGRLDGETGDTWYVGRRHVESDGGDPVVVDWRAPVSVPFYRATAVDPLGLARRRRFILEGPELTDLLDEVFDDPDSIDAAHHGGIPDPLLAELERTRTGAMRDIVATIAADQDEVIRAGLDRCVLVQGGPGTGKTAVGLHRAAFLLYEHGDRLDVGGVLVIGPNPIFLRYIAQVLPSLGEYAVRQTTLASLVGGRARAVDPPEREQLLGDARMAEVLARTLAAQLRPPIEDLVATLPWGRITLRANDVADAMAEIAARGRPFATGRSALRARLARSAWQQIVSSRGDGVAGPSDVEEALRSAPGFSAAVSRWWPTVSGPSLVKRVLTNRVSLAGVAEGLLSAEERALVLRKGARKLDDETWTTAELVLIDEAEALANGVPRTYGHLVVDEAQDLSAMALRALARRCPTRSLTVLGDLAQATTPGAQRSWDELAEHLGVAEDFALVELDLGYRVPAPIMAFADRLLPAAAPGLRPTRSVRESGRAPTVVLAAGDAGDGGGDGLGETVAAQAGALAGRWLAVGVVCPDDRREDVLAALGAAGVAAATGAGALGWADGEGATPVAVVSPTEAKGLEFDGVVVVEPARFLRTPTDRAGARLLYVALTRAVQELVVVHGEPLPEALAA